MSAATAAQAAADGRAVPDRHAGATSADAALPSGGAVPDVRVAIVGAGFSGLGSAAALKRAGIEDFVVLERAAELGGTWRDNSYPGCACDVPSHLYSFSFAPNPNWSRTFSGQEEIFAYLRRVADEHDLRPHIRFGHELRDAAWDEDAQRWRLTTSAGALTAQVVIGGMGALSEPSLPSIPGIDTFEGALFHSATWDHDHDLSGERVAVIGTGASAIQFVPRIQPRVGRLHLFQRTPPWVMPRTDRAVSRAERWLYRAVPAAQRLVRTAIYWSREAFVLGFAVDQRLMRVPEWIARRHIARQVPDPALRAKLTPDYRIGCKRILISNDYYPALTRPNVEVVTDGIREVRPHAVVTADGSEREVDTIIFGTGFQVTQMPFASRVRGRGGVLLADRWSGSPQAHHGTTVADFPNLFLLMGPNTGLGHTSQVFMIEAQIAYVMACLHAMEARGAGVLAVRAEAQAASNAEVQRRMRGTVWTAGGCASWYLDEHGRNSTLWPSFTFRFRRELERFDAAAYDLIPRRAAAPAPVAAPVAAPAAAGTSAPRSESDPTAAGMDTVVPSAPSGAQEPQIAAGEVS